MSWQRLRAVIRKELIQLRRDPRTLAMAVALPAVQLLLFGYAINTVTDHLPTVVYDQSHTVASRAFAAAFQNSGYFDIRLWATSRDEALHAIDAGTAKVALVMPPDFGDQVLAGRPTSAQLVIDGSDPNVAQTATFAGGLVAQVQSGRAIAIVSSRLGPGAGAGGIDLRPLVLYNPRMLSAVFMVPGLIGMIIQLQAVLLTAFAVVRERERGTLEQLIVTPVTSLELMLGKVLPNAALAFGSVLITLFLARLLFDVPFVGSLLLLLLLVVPFLLGSLGIGLLISVVSQTQTQALQMGFFTILPTIMLSGLIFAREGMPLFFQLIGYLLPLTYFLQVLRGIILKGVDLSVLWPQALVLTVFAIAVLMMAVSQFRKRVN
jgi:ABC-2 type transport system permease protein